MKVSMVTSTNSDPQRKTRAASETAPATAPPPARSTARSVENRPDASPDTDSGLVSVLHFDAQARGAQPDVSPIEDAAAAARSVEWARQSILGHPAQAMFAQANSNPESALRLLA